MEVPSLLAHAQWLLSVQTFATPQVDQEGRTSLQIPHYEVGMMALGDRLAPAIRSW